MASRSTLRTLLLVYLGTSSDDPAYPPATLNLLLQQAYDSLLTDLQATNAGLFSKTITLAADSVSSHNYNLYTQAADFARWLEVRYTDANGALFEESRFEELRAAGSDYFAIVGAEGDANLALVTSPDSTPGTPLFFRYAYWPAEFTADGDVPLIPSRFHDVVALEALFAFGLGGESQTPPELRARWMERRGQLMHRAGQRGIQPSRTRLDPHAEAF